MPARSRIPRTIVLAAAVAAALLAEPSVVHAKNRKPSAYPEGFQLDDALNFFSVESAGLLKRSMLSAGFSVDETVESNDAYLEFASRALAAEMERVQGVRDALKEEQIVARVDEAKSGAPTREQPQTCSAEDGECKEAGSKEAAEKAKDDKLSPEFGHFLTPDLKPGEADILRWEDGSVVQPYAARVGLPPQLVPTLIEYAKEMGLYEIMESMMYEDPLPPNGARWFSFQSPYQRGAPESELRNFTWNVERPAKDWKSDMHWFNTADELSHEDALRALAKGGFDEVLAGIGEKFGLDMLHVDSFGFVAVTNCQRGKIHTDWEDVDGQAFNFLVGIYKPDDGGPELIVEGANDIQGETYYGGNAGVLVGDGTRHGTRECDHRAEREVRITASIYLADTPREILDVLAGDTTSVFPPMGDEGGKEWIYSQRGRHWRRDGGGDGLVGDKGRKPFKVVDFARGCTEEDCENETEKGRNACQVTCKVFMDDDDYKPGTERRKILGY